MSDAWKVALIRAGRTALQAGLGVFVTAQAGWLDVSIVEAAIVAAGAAFFSSLQNLIEESPIDFMSNFPKG